MTIRVLLVEDNPLNLELHRDLLEAEGYEVVVAESAAEFRQRVATPFVPDIVLMDVLLPDGSGIELLAELRRHDVLARVPAMAITAQALAGDTLRLMASGFDAVIIKPIDTRTFAAEVLRHANPPRRPVSEGVP